MIPGDGIGLEVMPPALEVVEVAATRFGFELSTTSFDWGCSRYEETGSLLPEDGIDILRGHDAILLGAVGQPSVPDHVSLWGLLIAIRREFDQYVNLRPVRLLPALESPLRGRTPEDIDFVIVRENTEGEYSDIGGRIRNGAEDEVVIQQSVFTRRGVDRVIRYAFEVARSREGRLASATKSNAIIHTMPFWDERFAAIGEQYPNVERSEYHIDILAAQMVLDPGRFDVIVASNLFGDILSDLGPAIAGGLGIAPSANLNPERHHPSMFEPVHGSAPDIAGKGLANPIAQIWSAALMLDHLGESEASSAIVAAIEVATTQRASKTRDLGGEATTGECGEAIAELVISVQASADADS